MLTINKDSLDKDCSEKIHLIHHVAFKGVIIWPLTRAGENVNENSITIVNTDETAWKNSGIYSVEI